MQQGQGDDRATVYSVDDLVFLKRFIITGSESLTAHVHSEDQHQDNQRPIGDQNIVGVVKKLIRSGRGTEAIKCVKIVSKKRLNIRQQPLLYILALCARCDIEPGTEINNNTLVNIQDTKQNAFAVLQDVCRIPTHLCIFIKYYTLLAEERASIEARNGNEKRIKEIFEKEEREEKKREERKAKGIKEKRKAKGIDEKYKDKSTYGWGRSFKRAIQNWFYSKRFLDDPLYLAYLLTKYKEREGWSIKAILAMAHVKDLDDTDEKKAVGLVLRCFRSSVEKACDHYKVDELDDTNIVNKVGKRMRFYSKFKLSDGKQTEINGKMKGNSGRGARGAYTTDIDTIMKERIHQDIVDKTCEEIESKGKVITREHLPPCLLYGRNGPYLDIWEYIIARLPAEALLRCLGKISSIGIFSGRRAGSFRTAISKRLSQFSWKDSTGNKDCDDGDSSDNNILVHPFKFLMAKYRYEQGKTSSSKSQLCWTVDEEICKTLDNLFSGSLQYACSIKKNICLAVDIGKSMGKLPGYPETGTGMSCDQAAVAMAHAIASSVNFSGGKCNLLMFNEHGAEELVIDMSLKGKMDTVRKRMKKLPNADTDCSRPMKWAKEKKDRTVDAFVIFTVNQPGARTDQADTALLDYRRFSINSSVKMIVCTMDSNQLTIADSSNTKLQMRDDVVGVDPTIMQVITTFVN